MEGGTDCTMTVKAIGALLIVAGCSAYGFLMALFWKREEVILRQLVEALEYMQCDLKYHVTPLPDLCRKVSCRMHGTTGYYFRTLAEELEKQYLPDAAVCAEAAALSLGYLPDRIKRAFELLRTTLGIFDLEGQVLGLESVRAYCKSELQSMATNRNEQLRNYRTLGVCMGIALAIILV